MTEGNNNESKTPKTIHKKIDPPPNHLLRLANSGVEYVTDVSDIVPWHVWCAPNDYCKLCGKGPLPYSFEYSYRVVSFSGDTTLVTPPLHYHYVSEACSTCTLQLTRHDPFFCDPKTWIGHLKAGRNTYDKYLEYGLIDDFHLRDKEGNLCLPSISTTMI